jgi:hypothetical protein
VLRLWTQGKQRVKHEMDLREMLKSMTDLKLLLKNQKANNNEFMKEINRSEYDLIYLDDDDEIEAFNRLKMKD